MARVTGLGGIFYKVADPARTQAWYQETLGIGGERPMALALKSGNFGADDFFLKAWELLP